MAAITSANVTLLAAYRVGDKSLKNRGIRKKLAIVLSSQGGTAGDIPASALGLNRIHDADFLILDVSSSPKFCNLGVATDGSELITGNPADATDATRVARANVTGTLYCWVMGDEA